MSLIEQSATELLQLLTQGEITSVDLTQAYLDRIAVANEQIGAYLRVDDELALAKAADVDRRRQAGETLGKLAGLPVAVKDVLCDSSTKTTCASRMLENFRPPYDSTVVTKLKAADAVLIGRTNMDEFAMGGSTENSAFQLTRNPWDLDRAPGGSSGGAAACVAGGMAPLSIGTDTGGSIRQPAGLCGVVGLKPTYGRVSRFGLVAFASSLDQVGPLAQTTQDTALLLEAIAGHDPQDSTSLDVPVPEFTKTLDRPLEGLRLGIVREHFAEGLDPEVETAVREAIKVYESLGASVKEISLSHSKYAVATYYVIAPCEASSNLARYDSVHYGHRTDKDCSLVDMYRQSREEGFGPEVKRRIMLGAYALSAFYYDAYYLKALKVRRLIRQDFDTAFADVDLIAGPVTAEPAFKIGQLSDDPLSMYLVDLYTVSANLAGLPGISLPCGFSSSGLPIGLQLQAPPLAEETLLRGAHMYQQSTNWHTQRPVQTG